MQTISATNDSHSTATPATRAVPHRLDDLLALGADDLLALYRGAAVPRLDDVRGDLHGRMLAVPALPRPLARLSCGLASSDHFPWRGKTFTPLSPDRGEGINRVILDRFRFFRFETSIGPSRAGAFDAIQLDYDNPGNPFFIRAIKDEIRELRPGLYLGQAWLEVKQRDPVLALYFGLER
jgi:hypothetical protein